MPDLIQDIFRTLLTHPFLAAVLAAAVAITATMLIRTFMTLRHEQAKLTRLITLLDAERDTRGDVDAKLTLWEKQFTGAAGQAVKWTRRLRRLQNPDVHEVVRLAQAPLLTVVAPLRSLPNMLFLLGLFATVIGLSLSIGTLAGPLKAAASTTDPRTLTTSLSSTLSQMKGTFTFTVIGVLLAVISNIFVLYVTTFAARVAHSAQEAVLSIAAYALPSSQAAQLEDLQQLLRESRDFMQSVSEEMKTASENFQTVLTKASSNLDTSTTKLSGVAEQVTRSLVTVTTNVQETSQRIVEGAKQIGDGVGVLRSAQQDLGRAFTDVQTMLRDSHENLMTLAGKQLDGIDDVGRRVMDSNLTLVNRLGGLQNNLQDTLTKFDTAGKTYTQETLGVINTMKSGFGTLGERMDSVLAKHQQETNEVARKLGQVADAMQALSDRLDPRLLPKEEWTAVVQAVQTLASEATKFDDVKQALAGQNEQSSRMLEVLQILPPILERLHGLHGQNSDAAGQFTQLHDILKTLPNTIDTSLQQLSYEVGKGNTTLKSLEKIMLSARTSRTAGTMRP
ncbi:hypothetical protein [Deinococcus depolymerans]|uniref:Methyl-accepting chemotaxis protein n=1 Tax=Deinococcus depolymerans TaxID=392408 RepID=A0ABN1CCG2_9DEIO